MIVQDQRLAPADYPMWIKIGTWGVPGRAGLWDFVVLSVLSAIACGVRGFWDPRYFLGLAFLGSAALYWQTIRWIDRHGTWT